MIKAIKIAYYELVIFIQKKKRKKENKKKIKKDFIY
jgi:hypothetical protein